MPFSSIEEATTVFESLAELPEVKQANFSDHGSVSLCLSLTDHATLTRRTQKVHWSDAKSSTISRAVTQDSSIKAEFSDDLDLRHSVQLREHMGSDGKKRQFVEVWASDTRTHVVEVTEAHGRFITDVTFASRAIRHLDGRYYILYEADVHRTPLENPLTQFGYQSPMGETYPHTLNPGLFCLQIAGSTAAELTLITTEVRGRVLGQGVILRTTDAQIEITATAYDVMRGGRRLGYIYCSNRPASIITFEGPKALHSCGLSFRSRQSLPKASLFMARNVKMLSNPNRSARSPRAVPHWPKETLAWQLIWLESPLGGAHADSSALMSAEEQAGQISVREIVSRDFRYQSDQNRGLYVDQLPPQPFFRVSGDGFGFGLTSISGCLKVVRLFDLDGKCLASLSGRPSDGVLSDESVTSIASCSFLSGRGRDGCEILILQSALGSHQTVRYITISEHESGEIRLAQTRLPWEAFSLQENAALKPARKTEVSVMSVPGTRRDAEDHNIEAVFASLRLHGEEVRTRAPCVLIPHGGPHSASTTEWSAGTMAWLLAGFSVLMPNYHGSLGRSPTFVQSLVGQCGRLDIEDCLASARYAIAQGLVDKDSLYLSGGSHGGFISSHLLLSEPSMWQAVGMRNPVTHIGEMWAETDIRDWCLSELGIPYTFASPRPCLSADIFKQLSAASPLPLLCSENFSRAEQTDTPVPQAYPYARTLLLLGSADQRVPPSQGLSLYHALRNIAESSELPDAKIEDLIACVWFDASHGDDAAGHALDTVQSALGSWLSTWAFFTRSTAVPELSS